ncbi:MAG TPA: carbamoyltransferase HypF [Myxococcales bacterium]|nr:carbamoyltransferase HypF [Myxococcales bacterium]
MSTESLEIRVRGRVQGVGFRPTVWRFARDLDLAGEVHNDAQGVIIRVRGERAALDLLMARLEREPPPLAHIESLEAHAWSGHLPEQFHIVESKQGPARTGISPDAAMCGACAEEIFDPFSRRFRYPFTTCTHCGPRLTIVTGVPYDRAQTTLAGFALCNECDAEYRNPADRRFHAETTACHRCGPRARLVRLDGKVFSFEQHSMLDDVDAAGSLIQKGEIVAIKGLGGFHLACDATNHKTVARLRALKKRDAKPFALMARDLEVIRRFCTVGAAEVKALQSTQAPIVLLEANGPNQLPDSIAPGLHTLGFMLPTTPLHALVMRRLERPLVMTSGNLSEEPQATDDDDACKRLSGIASHALLHDRPIANRVDDSVLRLSGGKMRLLRRARGYAPAPIRLPPGFEKAPPVLAFGAHLKSTFCLTRDGNAYLSQHQGDLQEARTFDDYRKNLSLFARLFDHQPLTLAADKHPDYFSTRVAEQRSKSDGTPLVRVQHHHAHLASCLAENGWPLDGPRVLGVVLDGLGMGEAGELWGGEFLLADYRGFERVATFKPVALPGGDQAGHEPWRNLYAHLMAELGWSELTLNFEELEVVRALAAKPRTMLDQMLRNSINSPKASSCGRLFEAVAAALDLCREKQAYEGDAASRLEAAVERDPLELAYPFTVPRLKDSRLPYIEPLGMWNALLGDLILKTSPGVIAARFHRGLAKVIAKLVVKLAGDEQRFDTVVLSGGCFQNRVLFEEVSRRLDGFQVLSQSQVPAGDGGLSLGQAAIASALAIKGATTCA